MGNTNLLYRNMQRERERCSAKMMERRRTEDLMELWGLKETVVQMEKENGVRGYGHQGTKVG